MNSAMDKRCRTALATSLTMFLGVATTVTSKASHAAVLNTGNLLTTTTGVPTYDSYGNIANVVSGSWFGMDNNANLKIAGYEKTPINPGTDGGIVIGSAQAATTLYPNTGKIDQWFYSGANGQDYTASAIAGNTTTGLDLSGWRVHWGPTDATAQFVNLGTGAWQPLNCADLGCTGYTFTNGVARFQWDGVYDHVYTLDYTALAPYPPGTSFPGEGTDYYLHLEGTVEAVPIPAAAWLFGSGVVGLLGVARRKKAFV